MKTITNKQNTAHIIIALIFFIGAVILLTMFSSCLPTRERCQQLYPAQYKDTTIVKTDSVQVPFFVYLPGDTIKLSGNIDRPCPDSIAQWQRFTQQINNILAQNKKYKQTIDFNNNLFTSQLRISNDSLLRYKMLYSKEVEKQRTNIMPVVSYVNKVPAWCWWLLGFFGLILGAGIVGIILKIAK